MPDTRSPRSAEETVVEAVLAERLAAAYQLSVAGLTFLGGELDRNYRVTTDSGRRYLAKWQVRRGDETESRWREDILIHLAGRDLDVDVPRIVTTIAGDRHDEIHGEGAVLTVFDWVAGTEWARLERHSESLLAQLGATAARITKALDGFPPADLPTTHHWDVTRSRAAIHSCVGDGADLANRPYVRTTMQWFDRVAPVLEFLPRAVVHHDLNDNNVLVDENACVITGVLDFNDALYSVRVAELAIAGAYAMLRQPDPLAALGHVVRGYHAVTPLSDDELTAVYPLAAARLCVQALTWTVRGSVSPTSYGAMRMRHTQPTLEAVLSVDPVVAEQHLRTAITPSAPPSEGKE
jgi:hydroxylysine kinase